MNIKFVRTVAFRLTVPAILVIILGAWLTVSKITSDVRSAAGESLDTIVTTIQHSVHNWFRESQSDALLWASTKEVRSLSNQLLSTSGTKSELLASPAQSRLRDWFQPITISKGYRDYFVIGPGNISLSSLTDEHIGRVNLLSAQPEFINKLWSGKTAISLPLFSKVYSPDDSDIVPNAEASMYVGAPVQDLSGKVFCILVFSIDPSEDFTSILQRGRVGQTGESYAFDKFGRLISESRFDAQLRQLKLIAKGQRGILNIRIRNPMVNMVKGEQPTVPRDQQPLTYMAKQATAGESGMNLEGYRDYRGVPVIGAWVWDNELGFGITTEIDINETNRFQSTTRAVFLFFVLLIIVILISLAIMFEKSRQIKSGHSQG